MTEQSPVPDERGATESDEPRETRGPKRLPGLWVICVLFGLAGMFLVSLVLLATPLGVAVFGALAAAFFAGAVGLRIRSNAVRIAATAILGIASILLLIRWALDPLETAKAAGAIPMAISLTIIAYLWLRRAHFKVPPSQKPRLLNALTVVVAGVILVLGVAWTLLCTVDDPPREFPALQVERVDVPDDDNAFVVFQQMLDTWPEWGDGETMDILDRYGDDADVDPEVWHAKAREARSRWADWLAQSDEMLSRPHFVPPKPEGFLDAYMPTWLGEARELARRLCFQSDLHSFEGRTGEATVAARKALDLGLMLCEQNDSLLTYLTGLAVVALGLDQTRTVAAARTATVPMLAPAIGKLEMADRLEQSLVRAVGQELAIAEMMCHYYKSLSWLADVAATERERDNRGARAKWMAMLFDDAMPLIKVNMTRNLLGERITAYVAQPDRFVGTVPWIRGGRLRDHAARVGLVHLLRNPLGDILADMQMPAIWRTAGVHFRAVADARLTQVFLALRCYHLEHGKLPGTLDELAPEYFEQVPLDPFAEGPFRYEAGAETPVIYSVGPDQAPDGPDTEDPDDIVAELTFAAPQTGRQE